MERSVKVERESPVLFEFKYEMDARLETSNITQKYPTRIESPQQFQQQILQSPFNTDKTPSSANNMYSSQMEEQPISRSNDDETSESSTTREEPVLHQPLTSSALATSSNQVFTTTCYSYATDLPLSSPSSSRQATTTLSAKPSSIPCSSSHPSSPSIPYSPNIPCSSCIASPTSNSSSNIPCQTTIPCSANIPCSSNIQCSPSMTSLSRSSPPGCSEQGVSNLVPRDVNVSSLIGTGVTISRRSTEESSCIGNDRLVIPMREMAPALRPVPGQKTGAGISDAVTRILDDVDWSIIPMANKYV